MRVYTAKRGGISMGEISSTDRAHAYVVCTVSTYTLKLAPAIV